MFIHFLLVTVLVKLKYSSTIDNVNFTFLIVTWRGGDLQFLQNKILNNSRNNISWNSVILSANSTKYNTNLTYCLHLIQSMIEYVVNSTSICTCPRLKRIFLEVLLWKEDASSKLLSSTRKTMYQNEKTKS